MLSIKDVCDFIKSLYPETDFVPLHEPKFGSKELENVTETIRTTFVSSVGSYVNLFEEMVAKIAGTRYAVATVNGTSALHVALLASGVKANDEVVTQSLTFVATSNAISYIGAHPVFIDVDDDTMGMSANALQNFLKKNVILRNNIAYNKKTNRKITACVPMHTLGFPCKIDQIATLCKEWNIALIEDAAESLGSYYQGKHTGGFGTTGVFSFNGNKIVTCGGGGAIVTNDESLARFAKHITTQAKRVHPWEFDHDQIGYNYRMPNLNAALGCAQLEQLERFVESKRNLSDKYHEFFTGADILYKREQAEARANYWLNTIQFNNREQRDYFLKYANENGVMSRPVWKLMSALPMFEHCQNDGLVTSKFLAERLVNIPSSVQL